MIDCTDEIANALYLSGCIKFGTFKIKSGVESPYYIDMARILSEPRQLCIIVDAAVYKIKEIAETEQINKLASIELKGALIVPSIACRLELPSVIVRKEEKAYGVKGRIAGADVCRGDNFLFFDDVISEGLSKVEGIKTLTELGANVKHLLVVVNREHGGKEYLEKLGYKVHALAKISDIVSSLVRNGKLTTEQSEKMLGYLKQFKHII